MVLAIEWYLDQIADFVNDCDPGVRARIKWYINWVLAQDGPSHVTKDQKRQIYEAYLYNRDGRVKFAQSMVNPVQVRYKYYREILDTLAQPMNWTWAGVLEGIRGAIIEYENFLSIYPEDERFIPAVCDIRTGLVMIIALYEEALGICGGLDLHEVIPGVGPPLEVTPTSAVT